MVANLVNSAEEFSSVISRTSLMHDIYRMLLNTGRTYAAFERERIEPLLSRLRERSEIIDPMSGYGSLMNYCAQSEYNLSAYNIEYNAPSYFWQVLQHPKNNSTFIKFIKTIIPMIESLPEASCLASINDTWYPEQSIVILTKLWDLCNEIFDSFVTALDKRERFVLAYLLPFVGRLGSFVQGNVVIHVKPGGICVYKDWKKDFKLYNQVLLNNLNALKACTKNDKHSLTLADSRNAKLPKNRFSAMITSPPYPNSRDYSTMFAPENEFIKLLKKINILNLEVDGRRLIGSPKVSEKDGYNKKSIADVKSKSAISFISDLNSSKFNNNAKYDNDIYYVPYYCNYFCDIEMAYENISKSLKQDFEGYIIVVNNTARKKVIPVAEAIIETWERLGFNAAIDDEFTREMSHVGGINPGVKGLSARHMEYTIKVWRS